MRKALIWPKLARTRSSCCGKQTTSLLHFCLVGIAKWFAPIHDDLRVYIHYHWGQELDHGWVGGLDNTHNQDVHTLVTVLTVSPVLSFNFNGHTRSFKHALEVRARLERPFEAGKTKLLMVLQYVLLIPVLYEMTKRIPAILVPEVRETTPAHFLITNSPRLGYG